MSDRLLRDGLSVEENTRRCRVPIEDRHLDLCPPRLEAALSRSDMKTQTLLGRLAVILHAKEVVLLIRKADSVVLIERAYALRSLILRIDLELQRTIRLFLRALDKRRERQDGSSPHKDWKHVQLRLYLE